MKLRLNLKLSVHGNAARYYEQAKEAKKKAEGVEKAIAATKQELADAGKEAADKKKQVKVRREKKWHEKFHWFTTGGGRLAIGGRDAQQNDLVFSRHMDDSDLFFHADIQGGSAVVLKDGVNAGEKELLETAQFAASFSKAWNNGNASVDVYAVRKTQLAKHAGGGYVGAGAFAITGERRWFRGTKLALRVGKESGSVVVVPEVCEKRLDGQITLLPARGGKEKGELAKLIAKKLEVHVDEAMQILPAGGSRIVQAK